MLAHVGEIVLNPPPNIVTENISLIFFVRGKAQIFLYADFFVLCREQFVFD